MLMTQRRDHQSHSSSGGADISMNTAADVQSHAGAVLRGKIRAESRARAHTRSPIEPLRSPQPPQPLAEPLRFQKDSSSFNETIRLAQQGNAEAFETIYKLHSRRVYALCLRMLGDPVDAEDLTQEAFLQLFRKIHTFRGESAFSSWLYRLTANVVLMRFRKKKPLTASLDDITRAGDDQERLALEIGSPDLRLTGLFDRV